MAQWFVERLTRDAGESQCFRIYPEGEPERWIAETNPTMPFDLQEHFALLIAAELSEIMGD